METIKLYFTDSHISRFDATVTGCNPAGEGRFAVTLDRTAFFPGGGGQAADSGHIGDAAVLDMREDGETIYHITGSALEVGRVYTCEIDWESRFRRMQNHSGEHIVSGIVKRLHGLNNIGFHMGSDDITIDFDGFLDMAQLRRVERLANEAVAADRKIFAFFPSAEELKSLEYRSKKELEGQVRIVEIEDFDRCACCAPHLSSTGEVGMIKVLDSVRYKGGVRVHLLCGFDALDDYNRRLDIGSRISALLSAKQSELDLAVERLHEECGKLRGEVGELRRRIYALRAASLPETDGNIVLFEEGDENGLRYLVNLCLPKCGGIVAAFSGDDERGYKYVCASARVDLRTASREINAAISGRGGGSKTMIQGSAAASAAAIGEFFAHYNPEV